MDATTIITAASAISVGVILAAEGLGSAIGWGLLCSKTLDGISPVSFTNLRAQ